MRLERGARVVIRFRHVRIGLLLLVLVVVALTTWQTRARTTDWDDTLWVAVYPIDADGRPQTAAYLQSLQEPDFQPIAEFLADEAHRFGVTLERPFHFVLAPPVAEQPPAPPRPANPVSAAWWSLRMRYWAWRHDTYTGPRPDIRLFVVYHDPEVSPRVPHSVGMQKGLLGVVHAYAAERQRAPNLVIMTHELLHTLGATDKYDPATTLPSYPEGFAEPSAQPLYPQRYAELMGGRVPVSESEAQIPRSLREVRVGPQTAREIGWQR